MIIDFLFHRLDTIPSLTPIRRGCFLSRIHKFCLQLGLPEHQLLMWKRISDHNLVYFLQWCSYQIKFLLSLRYSLTCICIIEGFITYNFFNYSDQWFWFVVSKYHLQQTLLYYFILWNFITKWAGLSHARFSTTFFVGLKISKSCFRTTCRLSNYARRLLLFR